MELTGGISQPAKNTEVIEEDCEEHWKLLIWSSLEELANLQRTLETANKERTGTNKQLTHRGQEKP